MKLKITFLLMALCFSISFSQAQKKPKKKKLSVEEASQKLSNKMIEVMELDNGLYDQIYAINVEAGQKAKDIRNQIKEQYPNKEERRANKASIKETYGPQTKAVRQERKEKLKGLGIEKAQWQKWKAYKQEVKAERKARREERKAAKGTTPPAGDPEEMLFGDEF